jgi:hypothetical protein
MTGGAAQRTPCVDGGGVFSFRPGPPPPTDATTAYRRPLPEMPYRGIPRTGVQKEDGTVSWADPDAMAYVRDVRVAQAQRWWGR